MALERTLGLRNGVMIVVGNVVGAGIFTTSGFLAQNVGGPLEFMGIWAIGGLLTLFGALTYAELGAMFPRAGGDYQYLKEAYGPWAGFTLGWVIFWVITPGSSAALAIALIEYLPAFPEDPLGRDLAACGVIAAVAGLNILGTRKAGAAQDVLTIAGIGAIVALVVAGFAAGEGSLEHFVADGAPGEGEGSLGGAFIAVIFTYSGWFAAAYLGGELKNPGRTVPASLAIGTLAVMVLYVLVNAVYLYAVPVGGMAGAKNVALVAAERMFGQAGALPVAIAISLAIASCINANVMTGARVCYAMSRDGLFFELLGRVHPRFGTPHVAVAAQSAIAVALVFAGTFETLLSWVVIAMLVSSVFTGAAVYVLRFRKPGIERPYRVMGYPVVPALFMASYVWIAGAIAVDQPTLVFSGLILAASGLPFYAVWTRRRRSGSS